MKVIFSTHMTQARRRPRPKPPPPRRRWLSPASRSRGARRSSPRSGAATAARAGGFAGAASGCSSAAAGCSGAAAGCSGSAAGCSGSAAGSVSLPILTSLERDLFRFDVLRLLHRLVLLRQRRAARPIKEQHPVGDDLRAIPLLTVRGIPGAGALATLDIHPAALLQELTALLRQLTPGHHAEPFGLLA